MGRFDDRNALIRNYQLERDIEQSTVRNADGSQHTWKFNSRIETCEPFIRSSVDFAATIGSMVKTPSLLDEGQAAIQCLEDTHDPKKARSWIFSHLCRHATQQANALFQLLESSFIQPSLQLWRSLFEATVICEFIAENMACHPRLCQDYIGHTWLRALIRHHEDYNEYWQAKKNKHYYDPSVAKMMKSALKKRFGKSYNSNYAWTKPSFSKSVNISEMSELLDGHTQLSFFYRLSSKEIHPTLGQRYAILGFSFPLPIVPMAPHGDGHIFNSFNEMYLDVLTVKTLIQLIGRVTDFVKLERSTQQQLKSVLHLGNTVLVELEKQFNNTKQK